MTKIGYLDKTWNPTHGVTCRPDRLDQPLLWKRPWRIGVSFMGDLFHDEVPDEFIERVWKTMHRCQPDLRGSSFVSYPAHTFLVLTKRPQRMREFIERWIQVHFVVNYPKEYPNIHIGFSASTQADLDAGIEHLLRTPAAVRFVSLEPLVGPIMLNLKPLWPTRDYEFSARQRARIAWVIVGGESGHGARPMHPDWVRSIRDSCVKAEVPFYFKQWSDCKPTTYASKELPPLLGGRTWTQIPSEET